MKNFVGWDMRSLREKLNENVAFPCEIKLKEATFLAEILCAPARMKSVVPYSK